MVGPQHCETSSPPEGISYYNKDAGVVLWKMRDFSTSVILLRNQNFQPGYV